ncbi:hypothetical protein [Streptomyces sp. IMTB 1903]|uniref:hypothetical protein n=1 Tax=Streptomyces sp. IMTB 1903 TaxID=1776680 RepID=UPI000A8717FF|nr:hypothetical protein [Streptomyces sp. IMTB 1903]
MTGIQLRLPTGYAVTLDQRRLRAARIRADRKRTAAARQWHQVAVDFFGGNQ